MIFELPERKRLLIAKIEKVNKFKIFFN
jgi:hypothetical protein